MDDERPKFLYAHTLVPGHSQNSGKCLDNEATLWSKKLAKANQIMRKDVQSILAKDREANIVIAGDHGPYLTADCAFLRGFEAPEITREYLTDRYGTFIAIRWPDSLSVRHDSIHILQDLFFAIFATLGNEPALYTQRPKADTIGPGFGGAVSSGEIKIGPDMGMRF